jgi:hypothetical protein
MFGESKTVFFSASAENAVANFSRSTLRFVFWRKCKLPATTSRRNTTVAMMNEASNASTRRRHARTASRQSTDKFS